MNKIIQRLQLEKKWVASLVGLFLFSLMLFWWRLPDNLFFGFEQGRDALVIEQILRGQDFVLVGPKTDIGGVFHGAWYYYLMTIPYGLGQGNPLVASAFLVMLTALVPVVMAWLVDQIIRDRRWGLVAGLITAVSFEVITYSRWLSNVTPALLGVTVVFASLWQYRQTKANLWWVVAVVSAALAAQFEIILCLWFGWLFGVLLVSRWLPWPKWKAWLIAGLLVAILFSPMILFNLRNDWISLRSAQTYLHGEPGETKSQMNLLGSLMGYGQQQLRLWSSNLVGLSPMLTSFFILPVLLGIAKLWYQQPKFRAAILFFLAWISMTWLVIFFPKSLSLVQLYVGTGVGMIGLSVLAAYSWWQSSWGKVVALGMLSLVTLTAISSIQKLDRNQAAFFKTIQDDLVYRDQKALLTYIHTDSADQTYAWKAFAIPYFQEEGWRYLHHYWYGSDAVNQETSSVIYLIIEKPVEAFWIKKWTEELGPTELLDTQEFGLLRVEKRQRLSN